MTGERFLTPREFGDVLVLFGSGVKSHVAALPDVSARQQGRVRMVEARCGARGRKVQLAEAHREPPNTAERYSVCAACQPFCRGTDG